MKPYLQVSLNVEGKTCVVVGGGTEAEERVVRLLEGHAKVILIAKELTDALARWAEKGRIEHRKRAFTETDLDGCFFVLVCERDAELEKKIHRLASAKGVLSYAQDHPEASDLAMPALLRRGPLRLAISTSDASPALAGRIRAELERIFDDRFVRYLLWLDEERSRIKDSEPDPEKRAELLKSLVDGFAVNAIIHYPSAYQKRSS